MVQFVDIGRLFCFMENAQIMLNMRKIYAGYS